MAVIGSNGERLPRGAAKVERAAAQRSIVGIDDGTVKYNSISNDMYVSHTVSAPARIQIKPPRFKNVPDRSSLVGLTCSKCRKKTKPGMVVLDQPIEIGQLIHHVVTCKKCIDRMVGSAPAATDEEAFNQLREQIMKTGKAFPDAEA